MIPAERQYFEDLLKRLSKASDNKIRQLKADSDEEMKRYFGALAEQHDWNIQAIKEMTQDIPEMKEKIDMMFEHMGLQEVDISVLKETVRTHKKKFQKLGA